MKSYWNPTWYDLDESSMSNEGFSHQIAQSMDGCDPYQQEN